MRQILGLLIPLFFVCSTTWADAAQYGIFMVVKGDVKVQRSASETLSAKVSMKVIPGDTIVAGTDSRAKIVMSDRNVMYVSPQTQMKITKYEDGKNGKNVELELKEGKVFNNVQQKYDGEKSKFIIKTPTAVAGVRGTSFFVMFNKATQVSEVVTQTGIVSFSSIGKGGTLSVPVQVKAGEGSSVSRAGPPEIPKAVPADSLKSLEGAVMGAAPAGSSGSGDSSAPASGGSGDSKKTDDAGKKNGDATGPGHGTTAPPPPKDGFRMDDKKDIAVDNVDKIPNVAPLPPPLPPPPGVAPINQPVTRTPVTDAVRAKTDKSKVRIIPTPAP